MLSTHEEEVLKFIREFEVSSREYLQSKGLSKHELDDAYLRLQWDFLHTILKQHTSGKRRKRSLNKNSRVTA